LLVGFLTVGRRASVQYGRRRCPASFGSIKVRKLREGTVEKYYTLAILLCRCASVQYDRRRCPASFGSIKVRKLREGTVEKYYTLTILLCRCASVQYDRHRCPASLKNIIPFPSKSALVVVPFSLAMSGKNEHLLSFKRL
jgi:predicted metal-binding protein